MSEKDLDLFKTINMIFTMEVKEPKTYNLRLNPDDPNNSDKNINDILINVFINGMNTLFGKETNPGNITQDQFDILNNYMKSLGYNTLMNLVMDKNNTPKSIDISFELLS